MVGVVLVVIVVFNLLEIVCFIELGFGVEILFGDIYFIDFLLFSMYWLDVVVIMIVVMFLSVGVIFYFV